jgi:hypothetical protein
MFASGSKADIIAGQGAIRKGGGDGSESYGCITSMGQNGHVLLEVGFGGRYWGVERTWLPHRKVSAYDPKRTSPHVILTGLSFVPDNSSWSVAVENGVLVGNFRVTRGTAHGARSDRSQRLRCWVIQEKRKRPPILVRLIRETLRIFYNELDRQLTSKADIAFQHCWKKAAL